jgi:hypothetical protein
MALRLEVRSARVDVPALSGAGLDAQRAAIKAEVGRRGWELADVFEDAGISGQSMAGRPA